jgi:DNA-binding transcriptional MerR regulator
VDTKEVASHLKTDPKTLRRFLRSSACTFKPVGSGGRYTFTKADLTELQRGFKEWSKGKNVSPTRLPAPRPPVDDQDARDRAVWAEEGPVVLEDIRDPRVRARVRRIAAEQEARLNSRLLAKGLHITQWAGR